MNVVHPLAQEALTALDKMGARAQLGYSYTDPELCEQEGPQPRPQELTARELLAAMTERAPRVASRWVDDALRFDDFAAGVARGLGELLGYAQAVVAGVEHPGRAPYVRVIPKDPHGVPVAEALLALKRRDAMAFASQAGEGR